MLSVCSPRLPFRRLHRAFPAAAADYFFQSVPRTWIASIVVNALPFARNAQVRQSMTICRELLATSGNVLIIFPEGTRSTRWRGCRSSSPASARSSPAAMCDVLPCYLDGAFRAWPKGVRLPRPRKVRLIIGAPRNYAGRARDKASINAIAAELRTAVQQLEPKVAGEAVSFPRLETEEAGRFPYSPRDA